MKQSDYVANILNQIQTNKQSFARSLRDLDELLEKIAALPSPEKERRFVEEILKGCALSSAA